MYTSYVKQIHTLVPVCHVFADGAHQMETDNTLCHISPQ